MYRILNTLSEYTYFYISTTLLHTLLLLVFKIVKSFQSFNVSLTDISEQLVLEKVFFKTAYLTYLFLTFI